MSGLWGLISPRAVAHFHVWTIWMSPAAACCFSSCLVLYPAQLSPCTCLLQRHLSSVYVFAPVRCSTTNPVFLSIHLSVVLPPCQCLCLNTCLLQHLLSSVFVHTPVCCSTSCSVFSMMGVGVWGDLTQGCILLMCLHGLLQPHADFSHVFCSAQCLTWITCLVLRKGKVGHPRSKLVRVMRPMMSGLLYSWLAVPFHLLYFIFFLWNKLRLFFSVLGIIVLQEYPLSFRHHHPCSSFNKNFWL